VVFCIANNGDVSTNMLFIANIFANIFGKPRYPSIPIFWRDFDRCVKVIKTISKRRLEILLEKTLLS
jgi:hypothetical protein